jgi:hypothetical protein
MLLFHFQEPLHDFLVSSKLAMLLLVLRIPHLLVSLVRGLR